MTHKIQVFLHFSIIAMLGGCWVGDPADVDPNLPDIDTLNECGEIKSGCIGDKNGEIAKTQPRRYGPFRDISFAGVKVAHGGKFAMSALPPTGAGYIPYNPMMYPMGMYGMYPMGMYPYGMYPMMGGMPMMYGPWW